MHAHACGHLDGFGGVGTRSAQLHQLEERERGPSLELSLREEEGLPRRAVTNLSNTGLISVDRSSKATLLLTVPGGAFKSSAKDLSVRPFVFAVEMLLR